MPSFRLTNGEKQKQGLEGDSFLARLTASVHLDTCPQNRVIDCWKNETANLEMKSF